MDQKEVGKLIAKKRKEKGLTQTDLATKLGLSSYKTISKWENGIYMPDISLLINIGEILEISLYELLGGVEMKEEDVNNILKDTINKVNLKNKKLKWLKTLIIILSIILFLITSLFLYVIYQKNSYLFTPLPEEINLTDFKDYFPNVSQDNFQTRYIKKSYLLGNYYDKIVGIEDKIISKLPLYKIKNYPVDINAFNNQINYSFPSSETNINKDYKDSFYTKKAMFINAVVLYHNIANLENINFSYNDISYNISIDLIKEYFDNFVNDYYCELECEYWNYLDIKDFKTEVSNRLKNKDFLDEFLEKAKVKALNSNNY